MYNHNIIGHYPWYPSLYLLLSLIIITIFPDFQKQTSPIPIHSISSQGGVHNAKKCLFRENIENQMQSGITHYVSITFINAQTVYFSQLFMVS